ncbi:MAG: hypothetical protein L0H81_07330 [Actinomyces sp.]|nr:hypothetical protein [Actinomyces sp.]
MKEGQVSSDVAEEEWKAKGSPYCEHPSFRHDRGWLGMQDEVDYYCTTCGEIGVGKYGEKPAPRGVKPTV